jgi:hypothetical protein
MQKTPIFPEKNAHVRSWHRGRVADETITYVARRVHRSGGGHGVTATCGEARSAKVDANGLHKFLKFVG